MLDLMELHREVLEAVNSNEITMEEAEILYDKMFKEQVDSLILDVYEAYLNEEITSDEINAYVGILTEAVKGDKLTKKDKSKIDDKINTLPDKEKKAVEDSIKKASKEATPKGVDYISAIKGIDNVVNKKKNAPKKDTKKKVCKESEEPMLLDLDYELAMLEGANDKDLSDEEKKALVEKKAKIKKKLKKIAAIGAAAAAVAGSAVVYNKLNDKEKAEIKRLEKFRVQTLAREYKKELASGDSSKLDGYNRRLDEILADTNKMSTRNLFKNIKLRKDIDASAMIEDLDAAFDDFDDFESTETFEADSELEVFESKDQKKIDRDKYGNYITGKKLKGIDIVIDDEESEEDVISLYIPKLNKALTMVNSNYNNILKEVAKHHMDYAENCYKQTNDDFYKKYINNIQNNMNALKLQLVRFVYFEKKDIPSFDLVYRSDVADKDMHSICAEVYINNNKVTVPYVTFEG